MTSPRGVFDKVELLDVLLGQGLYELQHLPLQAGPAVCSAFVATKVVQDAGEVCSVSGQPPFGLEAVAPHHRRLRVDEHDVGQPELVLFGDFRNHPLCRLLASPEPRCTFDLYQRRHLIDTCHLRLLASACEVVVGNAHCPACILQSHDLEERNALM